jgi:hypothetical protein
MVYLLALIVVLVVSTIAVVMAAGAGSRLRAQDDALGKAAARQAALGVLRAVVNDLSTAQTSGLQPSLLTVVPEGETVGDCRVVMIGRDPSGQRIQFGLIPESGRISLHALVNPNANRVPLAVKERLRTAMSLLPGMTPEITAAIVDWGDADDTPDEEGGAERNDGTYLSAKVPYAPRNGFFETIEELRLVRGVTDKLFFGEDLNSNGRLDPGEDTNGNGRLDAGLRELLTVSDIAEAGTGQTFNINSADQRRALFDDPLFSDRPTLNADVARIAGDQPNGRFANRLHFLAVNDFDAADVEALWPKIVGPEGRVGLVDAWSCHETILISLVGKDIAGRIVAARPDSLPTNPSWLILALSVEDLMTAGMVLTSGGQVFRADLLAISGDGAGWCRLEACIDCATGYPRVTALRSADALGWPFPAVSRDALRRAGGPDQLASLLSADRN